VDGTPLTDLDRYRIYYGSDSRSYTNSIDITDSAATTHSFSAASGDYFVTMTALDRQGNESAYANEILRSVP
jgi:fibronectin type 3 domain-containing protein